MGYYNELSLGMIHEAGELARDGYTEEARMVLSPALQARGCTFRTAKEIVAAADWQCRDSYRAPKVWTFRELAELSELDRSQVWLAMDRPNRVSVVLEHLEAREGGYGRDDVPAMLAKWDNRARRIVLGE